MRRGPNLLTCLQHVMQHHLETPRVGICAQVEDFIDFTMAEDGASRDEIDAVILRRGDQLSGLFHRLTGRCLWPVEHPTLMPHEAYERIPVKWGVLGDKHDGYRVARLRLLERCIKELEHE